MEICIAVADWARGPTTWVLDVPGGEGTGARRRNRPKHVRHTAPRESPTGSPGRPTGWGRGAGMVVGWG
ncbi:hypothetical protein EF913_04570 [Streptomyces sp. WAC04189]|nr:hypothetical protein [Streptomyces rochei]NUV93596.1 hypothetical protein [Streptomyces sp. KAI 90]PVD02716.1 hypothetical protein DBP22_29800 [Streptomyces sp. CS207]RIH61482.1 hypothetical protein D3C59_09100 [Streptomyces sp. SHP22-7]RSS06401.1 hypothetical protein EF913_04570 [Streptomyces sp. WAC04189]RSS12650.1 hypothetical protein EF915_22240 [Streptomyces sp. WAC08401]RSS26654.1 hypothetical protein EF916_22675 [Streptomyces sp. WAC08452]RSS77939.1 hypothetical protein EF911_05625